MNLNLSSIAARAFYGVSMDPEGRARRAAQGYESECAQYVEKLREQAAKGGTLDLVDEEIARFVAGYRKHAAAYLASSSALRFVFHRRAVQLPGRAHEQAQRDRPQADERAFPTSAPAR